MAAPLWNSHDLWLNGGWLGGLWHLCASWLHDPVFFGSRTALLYIYCSVYLFGAPVCISQYCPKGLSHQYLVLIINRDALNHLSYSGVYAIHLLSSNNNLRTIREVSSPFAL